MTARLPSLKQTHVVRCDAHDPGVAGVSERARRLNGFVTHRLGGERWHGYTDRRRFGT